MLKVTLVALWLATAAPVVAAQDREIPWHNLEVVIRGDLFKAAMVAYEDFSTVLAERAERMSNEKGGEKDVREIRQYLATIENFDLEVSVGPEIYVVWIKPRSSQDVPGVFGGGATYTIAAKTFKVLNTAYSK